jgi:hypothetical protein
MASENTNIINLVGNVTDPTQAAQPDGSTPALLSGRQTELVASDLHGKHYLANYRGKLFEANVSNVVLPVIAGSLVSTFTLYNPPTSGVNMEITSVVVQNSVATTVVNQIGWYYSTAVLTAKASPATQGTVQSGIVGAPTANKGQFWTAFTYSGTPVLCDIASGFGATTNANPPSIKFYDGQLILPPGIAMSLAASTAVMTGVSAGSALVRVPGVMIRWRSVSEQHSFFTAASVRSAPA